MIKSNFNSGKMFRRIAAILLFISPLFARAVDETQDSTIRGVMVTPGAVITTADQVFGTAGWGNQTSYGVQNILQFEIDFNNTANKYFHNLTFSATCRVNINCYDNPLSPGTITRTFSNIDLAVNYNPAAGATYMSNASYKFNGAYKVQVTIVSITPTGIVLSSYPIFKFSNKLIVTRQYNFNDNSTDVMKYTTDGKKMDVSWVPTNYPGAESFDLEWTYVDQLSAAGFSIDSARNAGLTSLNTAQLQSYFRNNSSRVNLSGTHYLFNLNYSKGYILFRIRGVQFRITDGIRLEGNWNYTAQALSGSTYSFFAQGIVGTDWHEENLNWQYTAVYAEEGKKKEVITYYDGSLRSRQTVTLNNEDNVAVVGEPVYDALGRASMNILPAPVSDNKLQYYRLFNVNNSLKPVSYKDIPNANCAIVASPLSPTSGVEKYYSANNPFMGDPTTPWNQAIPKSEGFPFAVTQFTPDNTGRIRAKGGVGKDFQLATGHETKYYYGKPSQYELDRLFGAEAGDHTHYLKNMVQEANGQVSVSYQNSEGKTVATALAGIPPANLEALSTSTEPTTTVHDVLLTPSSFQLNSARSSLEATSTFLVSSTGNYTFTYKFTQEQYKETFSGGQLCYTCNYDLLITIRDECGGELKREGVRNFTAFDVSCNPPVPIANSFTVPINKIGEYTAYFELVVNKDTLDAYTNHYLTNNTDIKKLNYFLLQQLVEENMAECYSDCEACKALPATSAEFVTKVQAYYIKENIPFGSPETQFALDLYNTIKANCEVISKQCTVSPCNEIMEILKQDVTPGGQYAEFNSNYELVDPEINVLARYQSVIYYDENGVPAQVENDNGVMVAPSALSLKEFIEKFEDSWANSLVRFHPEFCYYTWCTMNESSQLYNQRLEDMNDPRDAVTGNLFVRTNPLALLDADPFFSAGGNGAGYYSSMRADMLAYSINVLNLTSQSPKNILQTIDFVLYCGTANPAIDWNTCNKAANDPCRSDYKEWLLYKNWYLDRKLKYYTLAMKDSLPGCSNCFIPGSGPADPGTLGSCTAPPKSYFSIEQIANSTADGLKRIALKFRDGNEIVQWPLTVEVQMYSTSTNVSLTQAITFVPGFGSQEMLVQETFDVFTIVSVSCAQISADRFANKQKLSLLNRIGNVSSAAKNSFAVIARPGDNNKRAEGNSKSKVPSSSVIGGIHPTDWVCPQPEDFVIGGIGTNTLNVCYNGAPIPVGSTHSATVHFDLVLECPGGTMLSTAVMNFCPSTPNCQDYLLDNGCTIKSATISFIECDVASCADTWVCPDTKSFTATGIGDATLNVCYTGPAIPIGHSATVYVLVTRGGPLCPVTTTLFPIDFCYGDPACKEILFPHNCTIQSIEIQGVKCDEASCVSTWVCPTSPSNYTVEYHKQPTGGSWEVNVCYTGAPIPAGKTVYVTVQVDTKCGTPLFYTIGFCAGNSLCNKKVFQAAEVCDFIAGASINSVECADRPCDWECPTNESYFSVTTTPVPNSIYTELKVCYTGPAIPVGKKVTVHVNIHTVPCGDYDYTVEFCSGAPVCISNLIFNKDCIIAGANFLYSECVDGECGWVCPSDASNYTVTSTALPNGNWNVTTCYTGPPIPAGKKVLVTVSVTDGCGKTVRYPVTFCATTLLCNTHQFGNGDICGGIKAAAVEKVLCTDEPCDWVCPGDASSFSVSKVYNSGTKKWEVKICYTGLPIPYNKTVIVPVSIYSNCLAEPLTYELRFCQGITCNTRILTEAESCKGEFTVTLGEIRCTNEPCSSPCPEPAEFTAAVYTAVSCTAPAGYLATNIRVTHIGGALPVTIPVRRVKVKVAITTYNATTGQSLTEYKYVWFHGGNATKDLCYVYLPSRSITTVAIVETECKGACPAGDCCDDPRYGLYDGKVRRFQDYVEPDFDAILASFNNGTNNFGGYPVSTCKNECEAMADGWILDLKNCTTDLVKLERVRRKLIDICKQSCEQQRGNPSIYPYSDNNPVPSFESVIIAEFGSLTPDCAYDLISDPYPFGKNPVIDQTFATGTNSGICTTLQNFINESSAHGYGTTVTGVDNYLKAYYSPYYTLELSELQNLFTGCQQCNGIMPLPVELPPFMDSAAKPCLDCQAYEQLLVQFQAKYPGITPAHDKYEVLLRNFLNHSTGFSHAYASYYDFQLKCQANANNFRTYGHICETPVLMEGEINPLNQCMDEKFYNALSNATVIYNAYIDSVIRAFRNNYTIKCLSVQPRLETDAKLYEYHYTLYYYDQSGNLVKTVPPKGVNYLSDPLISQLQNDRNQLIAPVHTLATTYEYNSFNQVVKQTSPDGGTTQFWYDRLGRLVVSQSEEQSNPVNGGPANRYSYTKYEPVLGRITETGEKSGAVSITTIDTRDSTQLMNWLATGTDTQITQSIFDKADPSVVTNTAITANQQNYTSRKRLVSVIYKKIRYASPGQYDAATHYSYDINGDAVILWQENTRLKEADASTQGLKRMDYEFDLISGKINKLYYQKGKGDQFIYQFAYDAENKLVDAKSSRDGLVWQKDVSYKYYLHGPLARKEIGELKVQGQDYAYTIQNWLKIINAPVLNERADIGRDGDNTLAGNIFGRVSRDVVGYNISYFNGDYKPIKPGSPLSYAEVIPATMGTGKNLYSGNIRATTLQIAQLGTARTYSYSYDQLNRIVKMRKHETTYTEISSVGDPELTINNPTSEYQEDVTYDPNGNILTYLRNGTSANLQMDNLTYNYIAGKNQLGYVTDGVLSTNYVEDIDNQSSGNYTYDRLGNLTRDNGEKIGNIEWNVNGKISKITKTDASSTVIEYEYDPSGNRNFKKVTTSGTGASVKYTYYVRDEDGNTLAVYTRSDLNPVIWAEQHLYGTSRVGMVNLNIAVPSGPLLPGPGAVLAGGFSYGNTVYELNNHLGNVLATISDKKAAVQNGSTGVVSYYVADVVTATDYYPFGMQMVGRKFSVTGKNYRYGQNAQEREEELNENIYTAEFWEYDARIARRWNMDPGNANMDNFNDDDDDDDDDDNDDAGNGLEGMSPYSVYFNSPIQYVDINGDWPGWLDDAVDYAGSKLKQAGKWIKKNGHDVLDAVGTIDPTGISDGINAVWYAAEGDYKNAAISALSMVPGGDVAKVGKYAKKVVQVVVKSEKAKDVIKTVEKVIQKVEKVVKKSPCGCFIAGTLVLTQGGEYKPIEKIKVGDVVLAYNDTTGKYASKKVTRLFRYERDTVYQVFIAGEKIQATGDHPFFIGGRWLRVDNLKAGDSVSIYNGNRLVIDKIIPVPGKAFVYNFEVEDYHTYYVSGKKVLVHNNAACQIKINKANGAAWQKSVAKQAEKKQNKVVQEITIKTKSGLKPRVDIAGFSKKTGKLQLTEAKGSLKAPLTKVQKKAYPEIEKYGGVVVGKGKPGLPGGTKIPPTKIKIVRKP